MVFSFSINPVLAETQTVTKDQPKVELTDEQKEELKELYEEMLESKKEIIKKYIEFGVLTEEKGSKILEKMESRLKELEENNYVPNWDKHHHHHHKD
ncbi:DUF2680 domain-containing protein [Bacillus mesophilus]|uniref:DUF2680 domain-containing protein n=2 Tax=Bacillus mesophilus TaxID=1808955 RepID=A0A6M0Q754_9BACI|nr:DUF2680 domain-containing protein [Bacillus mesophilus]